MRSSTGLGEGKHVKLQRSRSISGLAAGTDHGQAAAPPTVGCFTHSTLAVRYAFHRRRREYQTRWGQELEARDVITALTPVNSLISRALSRMKPSQKVLLAFSLAGHRRLEP
jgi:hypothetical protein